MWVSVLVCTSFGGDTIFTLAIQFEHCVSAKGTVSVITWIGCVCFFLRAHTRTHSSRIQQTNNNTHEQKKGDDQDDDDDDSYNNNDDIVIERRQGKKTQHTKQIQLAQYTPNCLRVYVELTATHTHGGTNTMRKSLTLSVIWILYTHILCVLFAATCYSHTVSLSLCVCVYMCVCTHLQFSLSLSSSSTSSFFSLVFFKHFFVILVKWRVLR